MYYKMFKRILRIELQYDKYKTNLSRTYMFEGLYYSFLI